MHKTFNNVIELLKVNFAEIGYEPLAFYFDNKIPKFDYGKIAGVANSKPAFFRSGSRFIDEMVCAGL